VSAPPAEEVGSERSKRKTAEEQLTVTGSRIRRKDLTTAAPVTVISREQVVASGRTSIGEFLQTLPEQGNALNTSVNNGGDGSTRISLRGLGANRTLVLINGRRFVPGGTGADSSVDLNSIPTAAIERIEILKDGASAIYGSDALGGVVNIITRRKFNGAEAAAYGGVSPHGDGATYDLNLTMGSTGERGNITFGAGYTKQNPIFADDRDYSKLPRAYDATGKTNPLKTIGEYNTGSSFIPEGYFSTAAQRGVSPSAGNQKWTDLMKAYPTATSFVRDPTTGAYRPFVPFLLKPNGDAYNFQPENYLVTPQERFQLYSSGDVRLGEVARGFFEASFVNRKSAQVLASEPLGTRGEAVVVTAGNVYNPFGRDFVDIRRRLVEFGTRTYNQDINTFRVVGGLDGTLSDSFGPLQGFFWELSANYGRTQSDQIKGGNLRLSQLKAALGDSFRDASGTHCGKPGAVIAGCVPLDLFDGPGSITADQIPNLTYTGTARGINQQISLQANVSGELFPLFADRPIGLAAGYEYRNLQGSFIPDPITVAGDTTGNKGLITQGKYYVNEGYAELSVPVINHVPLAESLEATAAIRAFRYSNFGSDYTYKFGGRWQVVRDLTFRGTYSTAFRAPSISDLYLGQADGFPPVTDPCRSLVGVDPQLAIYKACAAQGVPSTGSGDIATQIRTQSGGNPNLKPETAKIITAGIVLEPSMVKNLTITIDYYNILIDQTISSYGASNILGGCYSGTSPQYCDLIKRDSNGVISNIFNLNANVGRERTSGVDVALRYALPTEAGRFGVQFDGTWLQRYDRTLADGTVIHGKGTYDLAGSRIGGMYPAIKFNAGLSWGFGGLGLGVNTRFVGSFTECGDQNGDFSGSGKCYLNSTYSRRVKAYNVYDAFVSYSLASQFGKTAILAGVNNVFDKAPIVIYNGFTAASDPATYDFVGRFPYVRLSHTY
jgi:outer membrane receptor protein involved in Fe transport